MANVQYEELLKRMSKIAETVNAFNSEAIQEKAFDLLLSSCGLQASVEKIKHEESENQKDVPPSDNEIPGIAILEGNGKIRFTIRDIKAKNANDAGVRLALVAAYVNEKFAGKPQLSRKAILNPLLNDWRVYNGNVRGAIAKHRGITGEDRGDLIKLDSHAKAEAEKIINEVNDENVKGKWKPSAVGRKKQKPK